MTPPFALRQLNHVVLRVRSLPRALDFTAMFQAAPRNAGSRN